ADSGRASDSSFLWYFASSFKPLVGSLLLFLLTAAPVASGGLEGGGAICPGMAVGIFSRKPVTKDRKAASSLAASPRSETPAVPKVRLGAIKCVGASIAPAIFTLFSKACGGPRGLLARSVV